jgi:DNA-directed RNA polymerase specialized sigma24 family protein
MCADRRLSRNAAMNQSAMPASQPRPQMADAPPTYMKDATTRWSVLIQQSRWEYYLQPIANYLRLLGCPAQDVEDITHEALIKLKRIMLLYDRSKGPFRPYLKRSIDNLYVSHRRRRSPEAVECLPEPAGRAQDGPDAGETLEDLALVDYLRKIYRCFATDARTELQSGVQMLHERLIDGRSLEEIATAWNLSSRRIRDYINAAADELTTWVQSKVTQEDLDELECLASRHRLAVALDLDDLRTLFTHLSRQKIEKIRLLLAVIYRKTWGMPG